MNKNHQQQQQADTAYCCFHPRELVVGVCARCLNDRLHLLLATTTTTNHIAADQAQADHLRRGRGSRSTSISLPKVVLALGSSFLQRLDSRHHHRTTADHDTYSDDGSTSAAASLDDSFISIKFEDNGKATWDSSNSKDVVVAAATASSNTKVARPSTAAVVEHAKRGGASVSRWRKQVVGRLLQLARWKRSAAKAAAGGVGLDGNKAAERSKGRGRGWIRSLTIRRRRTATGRGHDD